MKVITKDSNRKKGGGGGLVKYFTITPDDRVLDYLKRAEKIYDQLITYSDLPIRDRNMVVHIAKMIQIEEK